MAPHTEGQGQVVQGLAGAYALQFPWTHSSSWPQVLPQSPQLRGSVSVSTQAARDCPFALTWHLVSPPEHCAAHWPPSQAGVFEEQVEPHWPQANGLVATLTHWPLQETVPGRHTQAPWLQ
jgi:hypothetical protein